MMPELGKYAFAVIASYGATLGLLAGLVALTLWNGARVRRRLDAVEARTKGRSNG